MNKSASADELLAQDMGMFFDDPLGWVMYAFPWDTDTTIQVAELKEPWASRYNAKYGPDVWACEMLDDIGQGIKANGFDGTSPVKAQRHAISSGHGIGKSMFSSLIMLYIMSTRPHCKGVVTANTADQLASKTWSELGKWKKKCITGHWFEHTTGKGAMRLYHKDFAETWRIDAQTSREENSESFAGLHAASSSPFYLFDEASAIPNKIWEVAEGGLTDGEPFWFVFGNPTRNSGKFFECFNRFRHRWNTRQIDSRTVQVTNKAQIQEWVDDFGEDSDFVRVRVRGVFPRAASTQFIPYGLVDDAKARTPDTTLMRNRTAVVGVDVARFGDDQSIIFTRIGRDAKSFAPQKFRQLDTMELSSRVVEHVKMLRASGLNVVVFVDGGGVGGGVIDRMRMLGYDVIEVQFGAKADDPKKYANKRAEIWGRMKDWLVGGCIQDDEGLLTDLTSVEYSFRADDSIILESKESMKKRGLASPDCADALAITFAQPVSEFAGGDEVPQQRNSGRSINYDPYAKM